MVEDIAKSLATTTFAGVCVVIVFSLLRLAAYF
jgi:hypothetical protein